MKEQDSISDAMEGSHPPKGGEGRFQGLHGKKDQTHSLPDPAQSSGQDDISMATLFADLEANLETTAQSILDDNFSAEGVSDIAILFGRMQAVEGRLANEVWAKFLALAQTLWSAGYLEATHKLLGDADIRLSPPGIHAQQVRDSRDYAEDCIVAQRIKRRFEEGDDEGAEGLIAKLSQDRRNVIRDGLKADITARRSTRRRSFIFAGVFGVILLGANIIGLKTLVDLYKEPPVFQLREFAVPEDYPLKPSNIRTALSEDDVADPPLSDQEPAANTESTGNPSDADPGETAGDLLSPLSTILDQVSDLKDLPLEPVPDPAVKPEVAPAPEITVNPEVAPEPESEPKPGPAPQTATVDPEQIYNCALAQRVVDRGYQIARASSSPSAIEQIRSFENTTRKACADLPVSTADLTMVGENIPQERIDALVAGLLPPG